MVRALRRAALAAALVVARARHGRGRLVRAGSAGRTADWRPRLPRPKGRWGSRSTCRRATDTSAALPGRLLPPRPAGVGERLPGNRLPRDGARAAPGRDPRRPAGRAGRRLRPRVPRLGPGATGRRRSARAAALRRRALPDDPARAAARSSVSRRAATARCCSGSTTSTSSRRSSPGAATSTRPTPPAARARPRLAGEEHACERPRAVRCCRGARAAADVPRLLRRRRRRPVPRGERAAHRELTATRIPHVFHVYPGGHSFALWQAEATRWLGLALGHLDAATD